jgi:hypothetical protein
MIFAGTPSQMRVLDSRSYFFINSSALAGAVSGVFDVFATVTGSFFAEF